MGQERVADVVDRLVAVCREGEAAYRTAAETRTDLHGQALFMDLAEKRSTGAAMLSRLVANGVAPDGHVPADPPLCAGPPLAADPATMIGYLREVEERTLDELGKALAQDLPMDVRTVIDQQYRAVRRAYGRLVTLPGTARS